MFETARSLWSLDKGGKLQDENFPGTTLCREKTPSLARSCPKGLTVEGRQVVLLLSSSCRWQKKKDLRVY
jgi:hypothetical protein